MLLLAWDARRLGKATWSWTLSLKREQKCKKPKGCSLLPHYMFNKEFGHCCQDKVKLVVAIYSIFNLSHVIHSGHMACHANMPENLSKQSTILFANMIFRTKTCNKNSRHQFQVSNLARHQGTLTLTTWANVIDSSWTEDSIHIHRHTLITQFKKQLFTNILKALK